MRVLITGAGGQLARKLVATAPDGVDLRAVSKAECDITEPLIVKRAVTSFQPDLVINTAAFTAVDAAEDDEELAFRVNAVGAENVAKAAALAGSRLLHTSTDYVFDGRRSTPYPPSAPTNPLNVYGRSKLEGERLTLAAKPDSVIVRSAWLYASHGRNFLVSILTALRSGRTLSVVTDQTGTPTSAHDLATAIWSASALDLRGTYHWANSGSATWYAFAREIAAIAQSLGLLREQPVINPVTTEEYATRAKRPAYSVLDTSTLVEALDVTPLSWQDAVAAEMRRGFGKA